MSYVILLTTQKYRNTPLLLLVAAVVLMFAIFKRYEFLPFQSILGHIPEMFGLSFIIFRVMSVLFEVRDKKEETSLPIFLNYTLSIFTFLSGPIQRYKGFKADLAGRSCFRVSDEIMSASLSRLFNGIMKVVLIAPFLQDLQLFVWRGALKKTPVRTVEIIAGRLVGHGSTKIALGYGLACFIYLLFLYFNFSGYTDTVIALGRIAGFNLPENFDHPFRAESFLEFWNRWHVSLSLWFRDYCFTPILKAMIKARVRNAVLATLPAYFICFGLIGVWHGRTWPFVLCGLMFALASVVNYGYRTLIPRSASLARYDRTISGSLLYGAVASSATLYYLGLAIAGFWLSGQDMRAAWHQMTPGSAFEASAVIVAGVAFALYIQRYAYQFGAVSRFVDRAAYLVRDNPSTVITGLKAFVIMSWLIVFSSNVPDFVYQGF